VVEHKEHQGLILVIGEEEKNAVMDKEAKLQAIRDVIDVIADEMIQEFKDEMEKEPDMLFVIDRSAKAANLMDRLRIG